MTQLALKGGSPLRTTPFTQWPIHGKEEEEQLLTVLRSGNWSFTGPKELEFAKAFADYCNVAEAQCVSNGSVSLEIALHALGIGPRDEVIVPSLTWTATALAVVNVGATPVFADVRREDWCLDPVSIRNNLSSRTRAIIPVHLYSQVAPMDEILAICKEYSLKLIEDCAHTHGSRWKDKAVGSLGDIGSFSFQQSKSMTSGEGGILIMQDPALAGRVYSLKNCGRPWRQGMASGFGGNYRITEFQAAVLLAQLSRLDEQIAKRNENLKYFGELIQEVPGISLLPWKPEVTKRGMYGLSLHYDDTMFHGVPRDVILRAIRAEGLPIGAPYEIVYRASNWTPGEHLCKFEPGADPRQCLGLDSHNPVAESISDHEGLVLPHFLFLGDRKDIEDVVNVFKKVHESSGELSIDSLKYGARQLLRKIGI